MAPYVLFDTLVAAERPRIPPTEEKKAPEKVSSSLVSETDKETMVNITKIEPNRTQPRKNFNEDALQELADSIKQFGIVQPLIVQDRKDHYEIIAGERRWRAAKKAGLKEVPVIIKDLSDSEVLEIALIENLLRENLSAIEEASAYQQLMDNFSHTQERVAGIVGKSRSYVANTLRLLSLPEDVKKLVSEGKLSAGHARCLVGLDNASVLADKIIKEDLNVRQVEAFVAKQKGCDKKEIPSAENKKHAPKNVDLADIEERLA